MTRWSELKSRVDSNKSLELPLSFGILLSLGRVGVSAPVRERKVLCTVSTLPVAGAPTLPEGGKQRWVAFKNTSPKRKRVNSVTFSFTRLRFRLVLGNGTQGISLKYQTGCRLLSDSV